MFILFDMKRILSVIMSTLEEKSSHKQQHAVHTTRPIPTIHDHAPNFEQFLQPLLLPGVTPNKGQVSSGNSSFRSQNALFSNFVSAAARASEQSQIIGLNNGPVSSMRRYYSVNNPNHPEVGELCTVPVEERQRVWEEMLVLANDMFILSQLVKGVSNRTKELRELAKDVESRLSERMIRMNYAELSLPDNCSVFVADERASKRKPTHAEYVQALLAMQEDGKLSFSNELDAVNLSVTLQRYTHKMCPPVVTTRYRHKDQLDPDLVVEAIRSQQPLVRDMIDDDDDDAEDS